VTEEEITMIVAAMIDPIVGRYLARIAAERIYTLLSIVDQDTLDDLLARYGDLEELPDEDYT